MGRQLNLPSVEDRRACRLRAAQAHDAFGRARLAFRHRWLDGEAPPVSHAHLATPDARDVDYSQWLKHWDASHHDPVAVQPAEADPATILNSIEPADPPSDVAQRRP